MAEQEKRFVGFLDVLGFSELVKRSDFAEVFDDYTKIIKECVELRNKPNMDYVVFSDTIIIVCDGTSYDDLRDLIEAVSIFSYRALTEMGLPIKGCISYGRISYNKNDKDIVVAGPAMVEAYHFEQKQDWVGVMLSPNLVREFPAITQNLIYRMGFTGKSKTDCLKSNFIWNASIQRTENIAFKNNQTLEGFAITPHRVSSFSVEQLIEDSVDYEQALLNQKFYATEPDIQKKYNKSLTFCREMMVFWKQTTNDHFYKEEFWIKVENYRDGKALNSRSTRPPERGETPGDVIKTNI